VSSVRQIASVLLVANMVVGCGQDDGESAFDSFSSRDAWCATYHESLPALSSPNPDGQELTLLDLYIARYSQLGVGAPDVTSSAAAAMLRLASSFTAIRDRVTGGEELSDVLAESFGDEDSELVQAGEAADSEATAVCT